MESVRKNLKDIANHLQRPSVTFKPELSAIRDGGAEVTGWKVTYGNLYTTGHTPDEAMRNFDKVWVEGIPK